LGISGSIVGGTNCAALTTGNQGCGIRANSRVSFGAAFNNNGGGTYAMKWDDSGVGIWFFPAGSEPADLTAGSPNPDNWGLAMANWPAQGCDPYAFFSKIILPSLILPYVATGLAPLGMVLGFLDKNRAVLNVQVSRLARHL